ncbi:hypothetical protein LQW54_010999 [Pestalotiopsis sp. IQ-011]
MSRRTVLSAGNGAFEAASRRIPQHASRSFSSTARNAAVITHFTPTSSPELDTALSTIREKIILPTYLTAQQQKRIITKKWAKKLQQDPITIEIDGEVFKFRHMDPMSGEIPNTRRSVIEAIQKFDAASDDDFKNLRPLLEGVHGAGRQLGDKFYAKVVRVVGGKGRVAELVELARSGRKTGFRLDTSEKANEVLHFIQLGALDAAWSRAQTQQALRWAELVIDMVEDEAHAAPKATWVEGSLPLSRDPQVLMAPLHLAAALVVKAGVQDEKLVAKADRLAGAIVKLWPADRGLRKIHPVRSYVEDNQMGYLLDANKFVALAAPLLHGLGLAQQVVTEPALAAELKTRYERLDEEIKSSLAEAAQKGQKGRGDAVYQKFFGGSA